MGSSVGVTKVHSEAAYTKVLESAFTFDTKAVVESYAEGQKIECGVLSLDSLQGSVPGEIVPTSNDGFYSYDAKYIDESGAKLVSPQTCRMTKRVWSRKCPLPQPAPWDARGWCGSISSSIRMASCWSTN